MDRIGARKATRNGAIILSGYFLLSTEDDGDKKFVRALRRKLRSMTDTGDGHTG